MHTIIIASYLICAAAFLAGSVLLVTGWRGGQRTGVLLVVATVVTALWAATLAYAEWSGRIAINWLLLAEALRYGAWLAFLGALMTTWSLGGLLRGTLVAAHVLWIALALYCLLPAMGPVAQAIGLPFAVNTAMVGVLLLALFGVVLLEQLYRNIDPEQRWALKYLVIALGVMFAYDLFLYSYAVLYRELNVSAWAARGFIVAFTVPLLVVAAARNPDWSLEVGVSRRAVFYSSSLLVVAFYIIATAIGGYYVRLYGGDWGRVAQITLICFALLLAVVLASSAQMRSRLRVFLHKNFFSFRHDYREEWMRLTETLSAHDAELPLRAVRAVAQVMDSPAGALFTCNDADEFVVEATNNMSVPATPRLPASLPVFQLMRTRRWIYDLTAPPPLGNAGLRAPPELAALPNAWLLVPLVLDDKLTGFVVLARARAPRPFDWEDIDLLRAAGSQVAGTLAQAADARRLAESRQFEGFNRLTAFLMHDLKNIAAQQSLLLQNAERHKHNPAFVDDMLDTVGNSVRRIGRLLEQLRGDAAPAARGRVQLAAVVERALDECRAQRPQPEYQPAAGDPWVNADAEQLATVLGHVIRNAQDAAQAHGHVAVRLRQDTREATIEIEDDGAGMDEAFIRERLFKPFYTTKASRGMGIGAYQAREYVRSLGGSLQVRSTPGEGSVFSIRLPLAEAADGAVAAGALGASS